MGTRNQEIRRAVIQSLSVPPTIFFGAETAIQSVGTVQVEGGKLRQARHTPFSASRAPPGHTQDEVIGRLYLIEDGR